MLLSLISWTGAAIADSAFATYSGRLTDGTGWGESATQTLVFRLYDAADAAGTFWTATHPDVPVVDEYFTVNLGMCDAVGACDPNPANASFPGALPDQLWIGIVVCGMELGREPVGSVPYAQRAAVSIDASALGGWSHDSWRGHIGMHSTTAMCFAKWGNSRVYDLEIGQTGADVYSTVGATSMAWSTLPLPRRGAQMRK